MKTIVLFIQIQHIFFFFECLLWGQGLFWKYVEMVVTEVDQVSAYMDVIFQ